MKTVLVLPLLFLGVAGHGSIAVAQPAGTFTATGDMNAARFGHTATLLTSGKVLIAGGTQLSFTPAGPLLFLASAEVYDPCVGMFSMTANMATARGRHTATLLPNGKVLIAGGTSAYDYAKNFSSLVSRTELYDLSTETFIAAGSMTAARSGHTATLLANGKVLIAGGCDPGGSLGGALATAELYDPPTGAFTPIGNMTTGRCGHKATLLSDGKVLILPGEEGLDSGSAEIYDPKMGAFRSTDWRGQGDVAATANLLTNGKVLVTLNVQECDYLERTAQLYDSSTELFAAAGAFFPTADMITGRHNNTATLLNSGKVLFAGGYNSAVIPTETSLLASAEIYSPPSSKPPPLLFSLSGDGQGQGAVLHAGTARVVSPSDPAAAGEYLEIYLTGLLDGSVIPPQVTIGSRMAEVLFFGKAPGYAALNQVNVRVPAGVVPGPAVPVRLTYLGRPSNEVTIGVR